MDQKPSLCPDLHREPLNIRAPSAVDNQEQSDTSYELPHLLVEVGS